MKKIVNSKVGIVGMGPVGMILAVKLKEAGCVVALCDKDDFKIKKIREEGIVLENMFSSTTHFKYVVDSIADLRELDLDYLVFALKSYQTISAVREAELINTDKLVLISAQNGIDTENIISSVFGESKTLRMVINYAGNMSSPHRVKVSFFTPPNYIGSIDDSRTREAQHFADILNSVKFTTKCLPSFELIKSVWNKTILNSSLSALCGVGRLTMAEAMADEETLELIEQIINEGVDVARKEKIRFPDDFIRKCIQYLKKGGDHFPSLAVDLLNNRQTEIDYFNGKIVEYGKKHYVKTSLNLAFTNMVKAMTNKHIMNRFPGPEGELYKKIIHKGLVEKNRPSVFYKENEFFLGIDLGSAFTKFTIIDNNGVPAFRSILPTMNKDRHLMKNTLQAIHSAFNIRYSCATGYGRKHFTDTDIVKTEINCAAAGVAEYRRGEKNIIDIGGEDIKVIHANADDQVANFFMNDKCAAGTGAFLEEISERAEINIEDMSSLAAHSDFDKELNSFCTVFAKTEIMSWVFDGMPRPDIARGIYISIANKVSKMRLFPNIPTLIIGGVIAHHPYLSILLGKKFNKEIITIDHPQYVVSLGAALIAKQTWDMQNTNPAVKKELLHSE
ncbi:MAG TPA: 2-dehydropantoate 2-reductase [Bacteroidia bacterium]|nr:2-dehydropantoate 2-reductase [Bacteroidia bacterium]